ncbi:MAG: hypothetical protein MUO31_05405 [Thermodesulfovibrionales bacterium]|nr:hypothetical protein [Thermodesulfovibrionales bacterium]
MPTTIPCDTGLIELLQNPPVWCDYDAVLETNETCSIYSGLLNYDQPVCIIKSPICELAATDDVLMWFFHDNIKHYVTKPFDVIDPGFRYSILAQKQMLASYLHAACRLLSGGIYNIRTKHIYIRQSDQSLMLLPWKTGHLPVCDIKRYITSIFDKVAKHCDEDTSNYSLLLHLTNTIKMSGEFSIEAVLNHPYFWTMSQYAKFVIDFCIRLESLPRLAGFLMDFAEYENYQLKINETILHTITMAKFTINPRLLGLVRLIRNMTVHHVDPFLFTGLTQSGSAIEYWTSKFPNLVRDMYQVYLYSYKVEEPSHGGSGQIVD